MTNCLGFPQLPPTPGLFPHSSLGWLHPPRGCRLLSGTCSRARCRQITARKCVGSKEINGIKN